MFKKINYETDLKNLTRSINIKLDEIGYQIQYYLYKNKGLAKPDRFLDDKTTWKYYINLTGQYHITDTQMTIYNRYIDGDMNFTIDNINLYPDLKAELLTYGNTFNNLVKRYPAQESLIRSILLPVDITTAISSKNYTILTYNKDLLDRKEYSLMSRLQEYVTGFFIRWYIKEYMFGEDLYLATIIGTLYSELLLEIESIRISNIFTYEVHDYYMDLFFNSHLDINLELDILSDTVKMWLYKNLRYIERHTGKNSTLQLIVDKIFAESAIGVGEINLVKEDSTLNLLTSLDKASYTPGDIVFKTSPLNNNYIVNRNKNYELTQIIKKEMMLKENGKLDADIILADEDDKILAAKYLGEKTKVIEFDDKIIVRSRTIPELHVLMDNWFYYAFNGKYNYTTEVKDTNTNIVYNVTAKQGALMLIKVLLSMIDRTDVKLKHFKTTTTLRYDAGLDASINRLFLDRATTDKLTNKLFTKVPALPSNFLDSDSLKNYLLKVNDLNNIIWYSISNAGNAIVQCTVKDFQERIYSDKYINLMLYGSVEATIDEILEFNGIDFKIINNYDYIEMMKLLVLTFTGLSFNTTTEDTADMEKFLKLIKKIVSYSIQVLYTPVSSSSIESAYTADAIIQISKPLISATKAQFNPLEDFYGNLYSTDYKFTDIPVMEDVPGDVIPEYCFSGFGLNHRIDRKYGVDKIDFSMSINWECLNLYVPDMEVDATVKRKTFIESFILPIDSYPGMSFEMGVRNISALGQMELIGDTPSMDMSIDFDELDLRVHDIQGISYRFRQDIVDATSHMDIDIEVTNDRDDIALVDFERFDSNVVGDKVAFNMSIDNTSVDLYNDVYTGDVIIMDSAGVTLMPSLTLNDYLVEDKIVEFNSTNILNSRSITTTANIELTDE